MKKILAMLCMITCIFGLTACGSGQETRSDSLESKIQIAEALSLQAIVPTYTRYMVEGEAEKTLDALTGEEIAYIMEANLSATAQQVGFDKISFNSAGVIDSINSFSSAYETMGAVTGYGEPETVVKDDELIITIPVTGEKKEGSVEVIFSTKRFLLVESCTINAKLGMGEMMEKAALNTLLGMGTVFCVLILIMAIISAFGIIPKIQKKAADKKADKKKETASVVAAAPVAEAAAENLTDDCELVAVIAAAIAASEGAASTDGFVVRSIRRARRR